MSNQKLTQEEVNKLQELQQLKNALIQELGEIGLAQINLDARQDNAENFLENLRKEENAFYKQLEDTYGTGTIDLKAFEFVPKS